MLQLPPRFARCRDQMCRILIPQDGKSFIVFVLLDGAVRGQVSTRRTVVHEIVFRKEALSSSVVAGGEMDLSKPECILRII